MTLLIWSLLIAGVVSLALGLRGRVVASQLQCKSCAYNLEGMQRTPQSKCPECGKGVWTGAIVHKTRQSSRRILRASVLCLAVAFSAFSMQAADRLNLIDWQRFHSTAALLDQIRDTSHVNPQTAAWAELKRRRDAHQLDDDDVGDVMAIALDRHLALLGVFPPRDPSRRNRLNQARMRPHPDHAAWIQAACAERLISSEAVRAYLSRLIEPAIDVRLRSHVYQRQPLNGMVILSARGLGGFDTAQIVAMLENIQIDGKDHEVDEWTAVPIVLDVPDQPHVRMLIDVPVNAIAGVRQISLRFRVGLTHMTIGQAPGGIALGRPVIFGIDWPRTIYEDTISTTHQVEIISSGR